ncbi:hypothetical protein BJX70DRAFT_240144 [Aspergillus crustosus]
MERTDHNIGCSLTPHDLRRGEGLVEFDSISTVPVQRILRNYSTPECEDIGIVRMRFPSTIPFPRSSVGTFDPNPEECRMRIIATPSSTTYLTLIPLLPVFGSHPHAPWLCKIWGTSDDVLSLIEYLPALHRPVRSAGRLHISPSVHYPIFSQRRIIA